MAGPGYVPSVFSDSMKLYVGSCATGRASASSTTLDRVVFYQIAGQPAPTTFTPEDVGCTIMLIGCGAVSSYMPSEWDVQGDPFVTTIAAYVSPSQVTLSAAPITSFFNTGFFNIVVFRHCSMALDSLRVAKSIAPGTRDTFDFTVLSSHNPYIDRFTTIAMGQPILLRSSDPAVGDYFGGEIDTITVSNMVGTAGTFSWTCHGAGYDGIAGRRVVNPALPRVLNADCAAVFSTICYWYLSDEGIGVDATSGPTISISCAVGTYVSTLLDAVVAALAALGETWYWYSDPFRKFVLRPRNAVPAPWDVADGTLLLAGSQPIQLQLTETHDKLATFTYAIGSNILLNAINGTINGNGSSRTFNLPQKIATTPTITLNGSPQTVGILGVDVGKNWYWNQGETTLTQDSGGTILVATDVLLVSYQFTISGVASSPNEVGAVERQRSEAGSGSYDHVIQVTDIISPNDLLNIAESWSQLYGIPARTAKISTLKPGIVPGQLQHIVLPQIGVDGDFLVATSTLTSKNKVLQWDYTAYNGANVGNGATGLVQFINRAGTGTVQLLEATTPITSASVAAPVPGQNTIHQGIGSSVTFPNSVTSGNLLVLCVNRAGLLGNPPTVTDSQGNTWTQAQYGNTGPVPPFFVDNQLSILYAYASVSGPCTVTCNTAEWCAVMEFGSMAPSSPVAVSGFAAGLTPPTLTLTSDSDLVVTALCNVAATPTVSGAEVLLGFEPNSVQPGISYSYAKPGSGAFTSSLADSGGSAHSVFVSVAFKSYGGTAPPAQTVDVLVNPAGGSNVTTKGDLQGFSTVPARVPVGADGTVLTANSGASLGVSWQTPGASSGLIGTASFSASGGAISGLVVKGCISAVVRTGTGAFTVSLSPSQTEISVSAMASDDATAATTIYLAGTPNLNGTVASFNLQAVGFSPVFTRDPGSVTIAIFKL